ncbi:MAG: hypothetical protein ACP5IZ_11655 [Thermoprotei archaeon]|jgi:hypothetical protein
MTYDKIFDLLESDVYGQKTKLSLKKLLQHFPDDAYRILIELKKYDIIEDYQDGTYFINTNKLQKLLSTTS